jgi:hypothetical protein
MSKTEPSVTQFDRIFAAFWPQIRTLFFEIFRPQNKPNKQVTTYTIPKNQKFSSPSVTNQ